MAKPKPVIIDGEYRKVEQDTCIADVVPKDVISVVTSAGDLIPRSEFTRVEVPDGFQTNLSPINKGANGKITHRPRKPYAWSILMKKGGAHLQSKKTSRQKVRHEINRKLAQLTQER